MPELSGVHRMQRHTRSTLNVQHGEYPHDEPEYLSRTSLFLLMTGLLLGIFQMALDITIIATALPRITDTFHTITHIGWYASAYIFCGAAIQPLTGKIYTFFPMKWTFLTFIAIFELGSLLCGLATSSIMFIVGRAVAGVGSSGLTTGALSMVAVATPPARRPMFMSFVISVIGAGQLLGPLIGGVLTEKISWRWCFYINLPIGVVVLISLTFVTFPPKAEQHRNFQFRTVIQDFDLAGFALFSPSIIMVLMAFQWGGTKFLWSSPTIIGLLVGSGSLLVPLGFWEYRQGNNAMFPFPMLRKRIMASACLTGGLVGAVVTLTSYYLPLWFQTVKETSALQSAISTLPSVLSQLLFAIVTGVLCPKVVPYLTVFALLGATLCTIGAGLMTTFEPSTGTNTWVGYQIVAGAGRGFVLQVPVQTAQQHIATSEIAVGTAMVSFFQFFGGALFIALGQATFSNVLTAAVEDYMPGVDPKMILESGATSVRNMVAAGELPGLRRAYNEAFTKTLYLVMGASALMFVSATGLGWARIERGNRVKAKVTERVGKVEQVVLTEVAISDTRAQAE